MISMSCFGLYVLNWSFKLFFFSSNQKVTSLSHIDWLTVVVCSKLPEIQTQSQRNRQTHRVWGIENPLP